MTQGKSLTQSSYISPNTLTCIELLSLSRSTPPGASQHRRLAGTKTNTSFSHLHTNTLQHCFNKGLPAPLLSDPLSAMAHMKVCVFVICVNGQVQSRMFCMIAMSPSEQQYWDDSDDLLIPASLPAPAPAPLAAAHLMPFEERYRQGPRSSSGYMA